MRAPTVAPFAALALAGLGLAAVLWWARRPSIEGGSIALDLGATAGRALGDTAAGVVLGIGDSVGIPRTDQTECERALAEGRYWDASFACPAGDFLGGIFNPKPKAPSSSGGASGSW